MSGQPGYARGTSSGTPAPRRSTRNVHAPSHIPTTITTPQPPGPAPAQYAADSIQPKQSFLPPTGLQALSTTYPSRLRTGTTLLVQPPPQHLSHTSHGGGHHREVRRATAINYAEPSDDDLDLDDDDDDGGKEKEDDPEWMGDPDGDGRPTGFRRDRRAGANRGERWNVGGGQIMQMGNSPTPQPRETAPTMMVDKSYLGMEPPSKYIFAKQPLKSAHEYA
jgi:chromatin structure-remodeling complex subunit SFH1